MAGDTTAPVNPSSAVPRYAGTNVHCSLLRIGCSSWNLAPSAGQLGP